MLPVAGLAHTLLNPLVDAVGHPLYDAQLAQLDAHLLGVQFALWAEQHGPRWLEDVLLVCYYGHFVWSLVLAGALYARAERRAFETFLLAVSVYLAANYALYALVPAVGPRFFLAAHFAEPLRGLWLAPRLAGLMMLPAFLRDCFPSGHTGLALLVLITAWRRARGVFWVALAPCAGLIAATLVGRFHYAVDLAAALPLACGVAAAAEALYRRLPDTEGAVARAEPGVPESEPQ
nr:MULTISPECIES: phosphatase PAP2 family protein [Myxococcaceae]